MSGTYGICAMLLYIILLNSLFIYSEGNESDCTGNVAVLTEGNTAFLSANISYTKSDNGSEKVYNTSIQFIKTTDGTFHIFNATVVSETSWQIQNLVFNNPSLSDRIVVYGSGNANVGTISIQLRNFGRTDSGTYILGIEGNHTYCWTLYVLGIESQNRNTLIQDGVSAVFKGYPRKSLFETQRYDASLQWLLEGRNVNQMNMFTVQENIMTIPDVPPNMDGWIVTYRYTDSLGQVTEVNKTLTIVYIESGAGMLVHEGSSVTLRGHPSATVTTTRGVNVTVTWLLNGHNVNETSVVLVEESTVKIPHVSQEMEGWNITYRCIDGLGKVTEVTKTLSVLYIESETGMLVHEGSSVTLRGHPSATAATTKGVNVTVTWLLNGHSANGTSVVLLEENKVKIPHVSQEMEGWNITYRCIDGLGKVTEVTKTLSVLYIGSETGMLVHEGSSVTLRGHPSATATTTRSLNVTVSWLLNWHNANETSEVLVEESTMKIPHVSREMEGWKITYQCIDGHGNVTAVTKSLSVLYIESLQESKLIPEGAFVIFRGNPKASPFQRDPKDSTFRSYPNGSTVESREPVNSTWLFNGQNINLRMRQFDVRGDRLNISDVTRDMEGKNVTYRCMTKSGHVAEVNRTLRIIYIITPGVNQFVEEGSSALYRGYPPPRAIEDLSINASFMWLLDGDYLSHFNQIIQFLEREDMLWIPSVSRAMEGGRITYRYIESSGYMEEVNTKLRISYGPVWPIHLSPGRRTYQMRTGDKVPDVNCSAECSPSCNISWGKHSRNKILQLGRVTMETQGEYTCTVKRVGSDKTISTSIYVYVQEETSFTAAVAVLSAFLCLTMLVLILVVLHILTPGKSSRVLGQYCPSLCTCISKKQKETVQVPNNNRRRQSDNRMSLDLQSGAAYEDLNPDGTYGRRPKNKMKRKGDYVNTHPTWTA